jgi:hypothetical protein
MEKFSQIAERIRIPLEISICPRLWDHHVEGRAVLPAVEAMHHLSVSTQSRLPEVNAGFIFNAEFDKFLIIPPGEKHITAYNDIEIYKNDHIVSKLITQTRPKKTTITRIKEHVKLNLSLNTHKISRITGISAPAPPSLSAILKEDSWNIPPEKIYADLVPFGPAYRNIVEPLTVSPNFAAAVVSGGRPDSPEIFPLGSPFPLDAAFHAACAWGQRYADMVAFPVGFKSRHIFEPTCFEERYTSVVIPIQSGPPLLMFNIWIYNQSGKPCEAVLNVRMKDVSGGRMKPPEWVKETRQTRDDG